MARWLHGVGAENGTERTPSTAQRSPAPLNMVSETSGRWGDDQFSRIAGVDDSLEFIPAACDK